MNERPQPRTREHYRWFCAIPTRWHDNDAFGHINNAVYYTFFDTAVTWLFHDKARYDLSDTSRQVVTVAAETHCTYFKSISHPATVEVGMRCVHRGRTSAKYEIGVFLQGETTPAAQGYLLHVHVNRTTMQPSPIPDDLQKVMESIA